jgi:hypothetical protein
MLPLTVSFETVLQIFNNNFKQEDVKVGLFPKMRKGAFDLSQVSRSRKRVCTSACLLRHACPVACVGLLCWTFHVSAFLVSNTNGL